MGPMLALAVQFAAASARAQAIPPILAPVALNDAVIGAAINLLGDDAYAKREWASKTLAGFGPSALPALRAARRSEDPEVRRRAHSAWNEILKGVALRPALPRAAVETVESLRKQMTDSSLALEGKPSAEWLTAQRKLIEAADRLLDPKRGGMLQEEVDVRRWGIWENGWRQDLSPQDLERNREALVYLSRATGVSRLVLARAYSLSDDTQDREKAIGILIQMMKLAPETYRSATVDLPRRVNERDWESFIDVAIRVGALDSPEFVKAIPADPESATLKLLNEARSK